MPLPAKGAQDCKVDQLPGGDKEVATTNLFKRKRMKGWWPACDVSEEGNSILKVSISVIITLSCRQLDIIRVVCAWY